MEHWTTESEFIRAMIKKTKWKDRNYIENLLFLEKMITMPKGKVPGMAGAMKYVQLQHGHKKEYEAILKELRPEKYAKRREEEAKGRERRDKEAAEEDEKKRDEEARSRTEWKTMGGKP